ncbi:SDR family NAD(P)-dependent oxidoreductase [Paraburkholderia lycopersici]|uniref:NAD(P)-dependent dehydrogenase, short-chain alcohol dehydrogenase family n=1 Tax=Paraburkholderia lycopersici TaxID=416944 RepID=A0A1G7CYU6_9BURK|nr:SDR family NAD(P)-dependent oxidoreductase [Paraburkholderia lycopersici]SDE44441.1 NAD(P)-dependent dehydrogenase, short-chain alcohol dehydrogenase family [Paraburkholderia lycopersici]
MAQKPTVLVIGASRGLGLALAEEYARRGWTVIATVRSPSDQLDKLKTHYPNTLQIEIGIEVSDATSVKNLRERLDGRTLDVLFVNAGIARSIELTPSSAPEQDFLNMMLVNAFSPVRLIEALEDVVAAKGTIAVMSSELGSIENNDGFWDLYSSSKAALNMLMKCYLGHRPHNRRALLLVAPGWVRTEMGGSDATFSIDESIPLVVDAVARNQGRAGLRFIDRFDNTLPW